MLLRIMPVSTIFVDSRSVPSAGDPFNYRVVFGEVGIPHFKGVTKIELKGISFPKVENEDYVLLKLNDLNTSFWSSDGSSQKTDLFAVIYFDNSSLPTGTRKPSKGSDFTEKMVEFDGGIFLAYLHLEFTLFNGEPITTAKTNDISNHSVILEITHL